MPLPNTTGVQNAGVNPNDVQQKNDANQAMNAFFREFSAKMDNILNVRGNVQAGVFNSFGNNALTRGGMGMTDLLTDTIKGLFTEKEEEKEDPVVKAIKAQHAILVEISKTMLKVDERLFNIDEAAYGIRLDIKNQFSKGNPPSLVPPEKIVEENLVWPKLDSPEPKANPIVNAVVPPSDDVFNFFKTETTDSVVSTQKATPISEVVESEFNINNFLKKEIANSVVSTPDSTQNITQPINVANDINSSELLRKESVDAQEINFVDFLKKESVDNIEPVKPVELKKSTVKPVELKKESVDNIEPVKPVELKKSTVKPVELKKESVDAQEINFVDFLKKESINPSKNNSDDSPTKKSEPTTLQRILDVLISSDKKLDKLVKDKPISTREDELSAKRSKQSNTVDITKSPTSSGFDASPMMAILGPVIEGLKDFGLGLLAMKALFSKVTGTVVRAFTGAASAIGGVLIKGISGAIASLVKAIPGLLLRAIPLLLSPVGLGLLAGAAVVGAGMWAADKLQDSNIESGADIMGDTLMPTTSSEITPQSAVVDQPAKYEANKTSPHEAAPANATTAPRDTPKSASKIVIENKYAEEQNKALSALPIKKVQSDVTSNVNAIEQGQLELKKAQSQQQTSPVRQAAPVIQNSSTTNNQTIMPTRSYPTNTEPGYRRYMDNMLVGG